MSLSLLFILSLLVPILSLPSLSTPQTIPTLCSNQVVSFSPCLQYISLPPNNRSAKPSVNCCNEYLSAFENGTSSCLCYLVRSPLLLGFPISSAKILSLSSFCTGADNNNTSIGSFCSGSSTLPPLQAITGPTIPTSPRFRVQNPSNESPPASPSPANSTPDDIDSDTLPQGPNMSAVAPTSSSFQPFHIGSAARKISNRYGVSFGLMISILVPVSTLLESRRLVVHRSTDLQGSNTASASKIP